MEMHMKNTLIIVYAVLFLLVPGFCLSQTALAQDEYSPPNVVEEGTYTPFTAEELDELLAPIALYPDPLLAQILPAATFVDQIDAAARYVRQLGKFALIDDQPWDVSVKAVAHYPDVLFMMDQKYDWTVSLGEAYSNQPQDVMDAIQRLRSEAEAEGNLVSNSEQQVINEGGIISIDPAEPDVIYVPQYDPMTVYVESPPLGYGLITFGVGFRIGAWLNRDCDWHGRRIYYHGWQGRGWISRARPHVQVRNSVYLNSRYSAVTTSRRIISHDTAGYREEIRRNAQLHRERTGRPAPPARVEQRGPVPTASRPAPAVRPTSTNVYRGRDIQRSQPASQTGYGGYGSTRDAKTYRERGQTSRGTMQQFTRPVPVQRSPASVSRPAQRPAVQPAPRSAPSGGGRRQR
jgi:hypothetical protein